MINHVSVALIDLITHPCPNPDANYLANLCEQMDMILCPRDYKNPLHLDVEDRYLRRMGDKSIPDEAPPSLESFYSP